MSELERQLHAAKDNAVLQAQIWAQEARTQRATVLSILRYFGLPENDWEALWLIKQRYGETPPGVEASPTPHCCVEEVQLPEPRILGHERIKTTTHVYRKPIMGYSVEDVRAILATHGVAPAPAPKPGVLDLVEKLDGYLTSPEQIALRDALLAALIPDGVKVIGPAPTVERLMALVRTIPPRSEREQRDSFLAEIEAIALTLRDGVQASGNAQPSEGSDA